MRLIPASAVAAILGAAVLMPSAAIAAPAPLAQFGTGTLGTAAGELNDPDGVAVDSAGNLHVSENDNHRISVFGPGGSFLRAFGHDVDPAGGTGFEVCTTSCKAGLEGDDAGQFSFPNGLGADFSGNLYVAEAQNRRISAFTTGGTFLRAWGFDVIPGPPAGFEICTSSCQTGLEGDAAGQFDDPSGVAWSAPGNLYVNDSDADRISAYTAEGVFLRAWGFDVIPGPPTGFEVCTTSCKAGVEGGEAGQLNDPLGVATDAAGDVYVADASNNRIAVYTGGGAFLRAWGFDVTPGAPAGFEVCTTSCQAGVPSGAAAGLQSPSGVAVDTAGNVHVADRSNHRISTYTAGGAFLHAFGYDVDPTGGTGFEVCTTSCKAGAPGNGPGQLNMPRRVATDCRGAVYVIDQDSHRVQKFSEPGTQPPPCLPAPPPVRCGGKIATKVGTAGRNRLTGTPRRDVIAALGGVDTVRGLGGNDLICAGRGKDTLIGGAGKDTLRGERGNDELRGGRGRDRLVGGPGQDVLRGGAGRDRLIGGPGRDTQRQ